MTVDRQVVMTAVPETDAIVRVASLDFPGEVVGRQIDAVPPSAGIETRILEERVIPTPGESAVDNGGDSETGQDHE